jgi:hypothetical protein
MHTNKNMPLLLAVALALVVGSFRNAHAFDPGSCRSGVASSFTSNWDRDPRRYRHGDAAEHDVGGD